MSVEATRAERAAAAPAPPALSVSDLEVGYRTERGHVRALRGVDLEIGPGRVLGLVGESGCGKSTLIAAVLRLLAANAFVAGGSIRLEGRELLGVPEGEMRTLRGDCLAVIFQDPTAALHPVRSIGAQMLDVQHRAAMSRRDKRERAVAMLRRVGIADEPTSALDATTRAQILALLRELQEEVGCAVLYVSHHLGEIAQICDDVIVMYAGEVVERASVRELFRSPAHPYSRALLDCHPARHERGDPTPEAPGAGGPCHLPTIPGSVPDLVELPGGCVFAPRCSEAVARCREEVPHRRPLAEAHMAACHLVEADSKAQ